MGVLNITPDSFSDGGQYFDAQSAIKQAQHLAQQGADIIDIGGESTRPDAKIVSVEVETERVIPVIQALKNKIKIPISIDTSKPEVMCYALEAGATMINDVRALQNNKALEVAAEFGVDVCLMHMQGMPQNMQKCPTYKNIIDNINAFFERRITACIQAGINENKIILDPGFGFGKTLAHNVQVLRDFATFKQFGLRTLAGLSRKSMIGAMLDNNKVNERLIGSVTAAIIAVQKGADILRVHDVRETQEALTVLHKVENG